MSVVTLRSGPSEVRLLPAAGGRITTCTLIGRNGERQEILQPFPEHHLDLEHWAKGGLYPLVPYNGRIRNACLQLAGQAWPLAPHAGSPHTLHGISQRRPWHVLDGGADRVRLRQVHVPDAHWPWPFEAGLDVSLDAGGVHIAVHLRNTGSMPMPGGVGLHPYFVHRPGNVLRFVAGPGWPFDADYLPMDPPAGPGQRQAWTIDDAAFAAGEVTHFVPDWDGHLDLCSPGAQRVRLAAGGALTQLVIHRPAQAPHVCVEPVSHVPDGFNLHARGVLGTGTRILAPGEQMQGHLAIRLD
jgi:aldose 1-epimerase